MVGDAMFGGLTAALGSLTGTIFSLVNLNFTLYSNNVRRGEVAVGPARSTHDLDLKDPATAVLQIFAHEALYGPGAPSSFSTQHARLLAGDPAALSDRWHRWVREKRRFREGELEDRHLLKVSEAGRSMLVRTGPGASLTEWDAFGDVGASRNGSWSVSEPDGVLRISIDSGSYNLYVIGSRNGVHYGFEPESEAIFVLAVANERGRHNHFLKVTDWDQVRLLERRRRKRAVEVEPFQRELRWTATCWDDHGIMRVRSFTDGYRYDGAFDPPDQHGFRWGVEEGTPVDGRGELRSSRLLMLPIQVGRRRR